MPVAYRSSSSSGTADVQGSSVTIPVPTGAAIGDIALIAIEQWESATSTVTWPSGFTQLTQVVSGNNKFRIAWKRLTAADTGNYVPTWTGTQWTQGQCILISGAASSGDPIGANFNTATGTGTAIPTTTVTVSNAAALVHFVYCESSATNTPPTNFTEVQDANIINTNYRLPGASGTYAASGGTVSVSQGWLAAALIAVSPDAGNSANLSPAAVTVTAVALSPVPQPVTVSLTPATMTLTARAVDAQASGTVSLTPAVVSLSARPLAATPGQVAVNLTRAVLALQAQPVNASPMVDPDLFPATVDASGRFLVTGGGDPWPMWVDHQWNLLCWGGGRSEGGGLTPLQVFQNYASIQAANGFNAVVVMAVNSNQGGEVGPFQDGRLWDGIAPWVSTIGTLNEPYWARLDQLIDAMAVEGITVILDLITSYTMFSGTAFAALNTTNAATFGTAIGNRYKNKPNIIYRFGVDYFADAEAEFTACLNAIRATGDDHLVTVEYYAESGTRVDSGNGATGSFGDLVDFDDVYSYNAAALEVRRSYNETPAMPVIHMNGHYYQGTADHKVMDDLTGWALTAGSKGMFYGSEATWQWGSGAYAALSTEDWPNENLPALVAWFTALEKWHLLIPDIAGSVGFLTGSRGTDATAITAGGGGGGYDNADSQNNYLTGAVTADGTLGLIYTPTSRTVTIDQSKLVAGYTAKWVDPSDGSMTPATPGSSYAHPGNNSAGQAGWYLLFEGVTSVNLTPAIMAVAARVLAPVPQPVTVSLTAAVLAVSARPVAATPGVVTVNLSPAVVTLQATALSVAGAGAVTLTQATVTVTAVPLSPVPQPITVNLTTASVTLSARPLSPQSVAPSVNLVAASVTLTARPLSAVPGAVSVSLTPVVVTLTARAVVSGGPVGPLTPRVLTATLRGDHYASTIRGGGRFEARLQ